METLRLSHLEAAVALALEYGAVARDPERYHSEEWREVVERMIGFKSYLHSLDIDTRVIEKKVASIPSEMYGPNLFSSVNEVPATNKEHAVVMPLPAHVVDVPAMDGELAA